MGRGAGSAYPFPIQMFNSYLTVEVVVAKNAVNMGSTGPRKCIGIQSGGD